MQKKNLQSQSWPLYVTLMSKVNKYSTVVACPSVTRPTINLFQRRTPADITFMRHSGHLRQSCHSPPKSGRSPPKSCLGGGLGGILGGVGGYLGGEFGRTWLFYSLLNTYFELRGKLYINWILILWTSKLIKSIFVCPKNIFFVLGHFSWKIGEHRHFLLLFFFLLHIELICVSLESLYFVH